MKKKTCSYHVLWLDDHIRDFDSYIKGLDQRGVCVEPVDSLDEALNLATKHKFDLFLVDLRMPKTSGFDAIRKFRKQDKTIPICVLSSYLASPAYQDRLKKLDANIGMLDKLIPDPSSEEFDWFTQRIVKLIETPPSKNPKEYLAEVKRKASEPFQISYKDFFALPPPVRRNLNKQVAKRLSKTLKSYFDDGFYWVLFCGDETRPILKAKNDSEVPSMEQILDKCSAIGKAPYQYSAPSNIDDMWYGNCDSSADVKGYPTVSLELGAGSRKQRQDIHFDTGSSNSFIDFTFLDDMNLINRASLSTTGQRGPRYYDYILTDLRIRVFDQDDEGHKLVNLRVRAVHDWDRSPLSGACTNSCPHYVRGVRTICKNRTGLIGRNLILRNKMSIVLDGKSGKTLLLNRRKRRRKQ